ncbi:MAG: PAS domain-containing protein [Burkholderiales bacterium]|nr:MAG: PAS domain-containing protein [Burkholderiales bacterium]
MPDTIPADDRLHLIARARRSVLDQRNPESVSWLAHPIQRSWRRCLALGMDPARPVVFEAVSAASMRQALDASRPLLDAAAPVIRSLSRAVAHTRYFAILTDERGTVIEVNGAIDRDDRHASAIARVGVDLSEAAVGTTAIGASLTDLQPVWLHRGEHFFDDTSVFSCAGAPIRGPDGRCVGMLDLTGVNAPEQPALLHLVTHAARSIENALTVAQPHTLLLRITWPGRLPGHDDDGLICVDADGGITGMNSAAAQMLGIPPGRWQGTLAQWFATETDRFFDAARMHRGPLEVPVWSGLRLQVLCRMGARAHGPACAGPPAASQGLPLKHLEEALIRKAVEDARGNVLEAARALGISRATVYRKLGRKGA